MSRFFLFTSIGLAAALVWFAVRQTSPSPVVEDEPHVAASAQDDDPASSGFERGTSAPTDARSTVDERTASSAARCLRLIDDRGAAFTAALVWLAVDGSWRDVGTTDSDGRAPFAGAVLSAVHGSEPDTDTAAGVTLAVARADHRVTLVDLSRAMFQDGTSTDLVVTVPRGAVVGGRCVTEHDPRRFPEHVTFSCDRPLLTAQGDQALVRTLRAAGLAADELRASVTDGGFAISGLHPDDPGALGVPDGWRLRAIAPEGVVQEERQLALLRAPFDGLVVTVAPPRSDVVEVQGHVFDAETRAPIGGAKLELVLLARKSARVDGPINEVAEWRGTSDAGGRFSVPLPLWWEDVPNSALRLTAESAGYARRVQSSGAKLLAHLLHIDLPLAPSTAEDRDGANDTARVRWHVVVRELGSQARVASVWANWSDRDETPAQHAPRTLGTFDNQSRVFGGHAFIAVPKDAARLRLHAVDALGNVLAVTSPDPRVPAEVELEVPPPPDGPRRFGRITDSAGRPLNRASVVLNRGSIFIPCPTDATGRFELPPGAERAESVLVKIERAGFVSREVALELPAGDGELVVALERLPPE